MENKKNIENDTMLDWLQFYDDIEHEIEEFCVKNNILRKLPVDIETVADIMDLDVSYVDLNPIAAENTFVIVGNTFTWKSLGGDEMKKKVYIDKNADINSQRYALAYEIGINMLAEKLGDENVPKNYNYSVPILPINPVKFMAEVYAMCLLLPYENLLDILDNYVKDDRHASPIDNIEWIDYLADCAKIPKYNLCIGFSYISRIICLRCIKDKEMEEKYKKILQL